MFYREVQTQNRHITRPQSIKDNYADFAEAMIQKLKSYFNQCDVYHNQCIRDFKESLVKVEILCSTVPELVVLEIFSRNTQSLNNEIDNLKLKNDENLKRLEEDRVIKQIFN